MSERRFGLSDDALLQLETVYRDGLFAGRTVLVTGAGTGIGKGISVLFGRLGARVVLSSRSEEKLATTAALLDRVGAEHRVHPANIREPDEIDALFAALEEADAVPDVVINNAGGQFPQASTALSDKGWRAVIDTNLNGTWTVMQRAARIWQRRRIPGSIVNIIAPHRRGMHGVAHTVAARAAVDHVSRNVAVEWAPDGIRVNCVLPGPIDTEGMNVYPAKAQARMAKTNPMRRLGDVQDVAQACVYLAADSGKFVTGETLVVDGGHQHWGEIWLTDEPEHFRS